MDTGTSVVGILGRKVGMTQIYNEAGEVVPVTVVAAGPCDVLEIRTQDRDGYEAVQLGYLDKPRRLASRSQRGQVAKLDSKRNKKRSAAGVEITAKAGCEPKRFVREIRGSAGQLEVGSQVKVDAFEGIKAVDVVSTSKGRGFSGVMKRHNFAGQRATHGVKKCHRHAGGTGCSAYPSRLFKGIRMAGQYGSKRCTVRNQEIAGIDVEKNLLLIRGAVPGPNGGYVIVKQTNKL
jgi:large subunit ribosomal protein L3